MQIYLFVLIVVFILLLLAIVRTYFSKRPIARTLLPALCLSSLPIISNFVISVSESYFFSYAAYIVYLLSTDWMLYFTITHAKAYCNFDFIRTKEKYAFLGMVFLDSLMILLNPLFNHVFTLKKISTQFSDEYYLLNSKPGHYIHLVITVLLIVRLIFIYFEKLKKVSRIYAIRYYPIVLSIIAVAVWDFYYIIFTVPIDKSMLGYALCGLLVYYFSVEYDTNRVVNKMFATIMAQETDATIFFDMEGKSVFVNKSANELLDTNENSVLMINSVLDKLTGKENGVWENSYTGVHKYEKGETEYVLELDYHVLEGADGSFIGSILNVFDRTEEDKRHREERFKAQHDPVTGSYNMDHFCEVARQRIDENPNTDYVIVVSDIKSFKLVNDMFGRKAGDDILCNIANLVRTYLSKNSVFGRIGNDKFVALIRKKDYNERIFIDGPRHIAHIESNLLYPIIIHFGVYEVVERNIPISVMCDRAAMAILKIKGEVTNNIAYYDDTIRTEFLWEQKIIGTLDAALDNHDIVPYIQAQVDNEGNVFGGEALIRWNHAEEGFLAPGRFIPILEKNGLVTKVDVYMWEEACKILRKWTDDGYGDTFISVNISPKDFYFIDVYMTIIKLVNKYGLAPDRLRLEITENIVMGASDKRLEELDRIRGAGFTVEMDDFGSGYSSLNMLKDMPVDVLKMDMAFLRRSKDENRANTILTYILQMARALHLPVITEGVETKEQVEFLKKLGCDMYQGYYFSKPISVQDFEDKYIYKDGTLE